MKSTTAIARIATALKAELLENGHLDYNAFLKMDTWDGPISFYTLPCPANPKNTKLPRRRLKSGLIELVVEPIYFDIHSTDKVWFNETYQNTSICSNFKCFARANVDTATGRSELIDILETVKDDSNVSVTMSYRIEEKYKDGRAIGYGTITIASKFDEAAIEKNRVCANVGLLEKF